MPRAKARTTADYEFAIVGAGLAGLHCALRLQEKYPDSSIAIFELYNYVGGRVVTYFPKEFPSIHWENGAGRIHESHTLVKRYIKRYSLQTLPISPEAQWRSTLTPSAMPDTWESLVTILLHTFGQVSPAILQNHTVAGLLEKVYGPAQASKFLDRFPYRAETYTMRADIAFESLSTEMKSSKHFFVIQEGLSELVKHMRKELEDKGVVFHLGHRLSAVTDDTPTVLKFQTNDTAKRVTADKVILALHSEALKQVNPFQNLPALKNLSMKPLLRTYHIYPTKPQAWFAGLPKTVTDSPLRYIIPINPKQGTIMSSYTDERDTRHWLSILKTRGESALSKAILKETRALFPDRKIPDPIFFKAHPWSEGCTYWLPGRYNPREISKKIQRPLPYRMPAVYVCGESFSLKQAWMEGALEHAEDLIRNYFIKEE